MTGFFKDLFSGNFSALEADISSAISKLPAWAQNFITTLESEEGRILSGLVSTAAQDVIKNGVNTASFVAAAKDVEAQLKAQEINLGTQTIYSALNAAVAALPAPAVAAAQ